MLRTERPVIAAEKRAVIRETVEKALDTRVETLANWLKLSPECRSDFPNGHFADISQALGLLKTLDDMDTAASTLNPAVKGGPRPLDLPALTAVDTLRAYAERFGYVYSAMALFDGVRVEIKKSDEAPNFYSYDVKRSTEEEAAAEALTNIRRSRG